MSVEISISKLTLDALKPREVDVVKLAEALCVLNGVQSVEVLVREVDAQTETVKLTLDGEGIDMEEVNDEVDKFGAVVRSVDGVTVKKIGGRS